MKILIVNTSDTQGGAARAAYRLHQSLRDAKIDSEMLVQSKISNDSTVLGSKSGIYKLIVKIRLILDGFPVRFYKHKTKTLFSPLWLPFSNVVDNINRINPDIVHLHWIGFGMIRIEDLVHIKAPIVWTMHDNWVFTGGCHIKWECERYKEQCGFCPRLGSNIENDLSRKVFKRKQKTFLQVQNMTIVALTRWLKDCTKESTLLKDKDVVNLPNPINTNIFALIDKEKARKRWNLPDDKKLILFGAMSPTNDINKGFSQLSEALYTLEEDDIELVVFGVNTTDEHQNFAFNTHFTGHIHDDIDLSTLYSACDAMVIPSLQENLSNVIMESLSCSTPVVAFDIGGNSDMIEHKKNGYLAKAFKTDDLANGIEWIINNENYEELCQNAREKVLKEFDSKIVAQKYIELYKEILNG